MVWIFWISLLAMVFYLAICLIGSMSLKRMETAAEHLKTRQALDFESFFQHPSYLHCQHWAEQQQLEQCFLGELEANNPALNLKICTWRSPQRSLYLSCYQVGQLAFYEWVSQLKNGKTLCTSSTKDSLMLPTSHFIQAFHGGELETLYSHHQQALHWLQQQGQQEAEPSKQPVRELMLKVIREQVAEIKRIPFWFLEMGVWYLWRRNQLNNRPLAPQNQPRPVA